MQGVRIFFDSENPKSYSIYFPKSKKVKKIRGSENEISVFSAGFEIFFGNETFEFINFQEKESSFIFETRGKRKAKTVYEFAKFDPSLKSILFFNKYGKKKSKFTPRKSNLFNGIQRITGFKTENFIEKEIIESNISNCIFLELNQAWFNDSFLANQNFVEKIDPKISP